MRIDGRVLRKADQTVRFCTVATPIQYIDLPMTVYRLARSPSIRRRGRRASSANPPIVAVMRLSGLRDCH
jgi:hypothetical protein